MIKLSSVSDTVPGAPEHIQLLTLDSPPENGWNGDALDELHDLLGGLARKSPSPPLVVTGAGAEWFCGGTRDSVLTDARASLSQLGRLYSKAFAALRKYPALTVAAINGRTNDEGLALALSCDFRVASDTAVFGINAPTEGRFPMGGTTQLLPRLVGESISKRMMLCGLTWTAETALQHGLVDEISANPVAAAVDMLAPAKSLDPVVVQGIRQLVEHARMRPLETGFAAERDWQNTMEE